MKQHYTIMLLIALALLALPALVLRAASSNNQSKTAPTRGEVMSIDKAKGIAGVTLYIHVDNSNAPGNTPEKVKQQATRLRASIDIPVSYTHLTLPTIYSV